MKLVVTPVGTSLFTNYLDQAGGDATFRSNYEAIKTCSASKWDNYDFEIEGLRSSSRSFIQESGERASAELQSVAKIQAELNDDIQVHLLASDTIASRLKSHQRF